MKGLQQCSPFIFYTEFVDVFDSLIGTSTIVNSLQLVLDNLLDLVLDIDIVLFHHLVHIVITVFVSEISDNRHSCVNL